MSTKSLTDIVASVAASQDLPKAKALEIVKATFDAIQTEMVNGNDVAVHGFGKFKVAQRAARVGRNPKTGEPVDIAASTAATFSAAAGLKGALN